MRANTTRAEPEGTAASTSRGATYGAGELSAAEIALLLARVLPD